MVQGVHLIPTDGRTAAAWARELGCSAVVVFDRAPGADKAALPALAYAAAPGLNAEQDHVARAYLSSLGYRPVRVGDAPGLVVARTMAMLINEAADAVLQGVCTPEGADAAMKLGVNYPCGPFEWLKAWDVKAVVHLLDALDGHYRGERYRVSPWLRSQV